MLLLNLQAPSAEDDLAALLARDRSISNVLATLTSAVKGLSQARAAGARCCRPPQQLPPRAARGLGAPALTPAARTPAAQVVEDEHCATAESVKLLDGKLSALLQLLSDPDPAACSSAPGQAEQEAEEAEALREALEEAQFEAASLQRGNDALQAALESATALLSTARAEAAAMRHSLSTAEESAALELQVRAPPARHARQFAPDLRL